MSTLRIKKGAEINLFLERSRKRVREKSGKRYLLRVDGETESTEKDFSLRVSKGKRVRENADAIGPPTRVITSLRCSFVFFKKLNQMFYSKRWKVNVNLQHRIKMIHC